MWGRMDVLNDAARMAIGDFETSVIVLGMMRNEIIRLPAWLAHYRRLGCRQFVVIDNGSTDGTYEALQAAPDVLAVTTAASFGQAGCGVDWLNEVVRAAGPTRWVLFADADELLVYPGWPERGLESLIDEVAAAGCNAMWAFMLDMYPNGPVEPVDPPVGADLFALAPCFDSVYYFCYPPKKPWEPHLSRLDVVGGPRLRSMSTLRRELSVTWLDRFLRGQLDRVLNSVPDRFLPAAFRVFPQAMPALFKSPLVRGGTELRYINNHDVAGARYFARNAILCHFKFLGDFSKKVMTEVGRKEHYRKGAEYFRYQHILRRQHRLDLRGPHTTIFESAAQLQALGLFTETPVWPVNPQAAAGAKLTATVASRA